MDQTATEAPIAITNLDAIEGSFKRIRPELGMSAFGMNARVFEPGQMSKPHWHTTQEEIFFVHRGRMEISSDGITWSELPEGAVVRIPPMTAHAVRNAGSGPATVLLMGGAGGVVEDDAAFVADATLTPWQADSSAR